MPGCNARFAGRRKPGGGYSYYDFMQGRSFDIAGPNPTAEERKQIDREYIQFLDAQRREAASADSAKTQDEKLRADLESQRQLVGPPLVLTPKIASSPAAKRAADRSKPAGCDDNSLACGWSKLSAVVRDAFASSPKAKPLILVVDSRRCLPAKGPKRGPVEIQSNGPPRYPKKPALRRLNLGKPVH
jgi:hypothetical protein